MHLAAGDKITGSLKLRVRWVQSIKSFLHCRVQGLEVGVLVSFKGIVTTLAFGKFSPCLHVISVGLRCSISFCFIAFVLSPRFCGLLQAPLFVPRREQPTGMHHHGVVCLWLGCVGVVFFFFYIFSFIRIQDIN